MTSFLAAFESGEKFLGHLHRLTSEDRYPFKCQWEITCRCNLKCLMCYTDCFNTPAHIAKELSLEEVLKIMGELRESGVVELVLTGGEPMSRPDFKTIYCHAVQSGFLTTIYTNGTFINQEWISVFKDYPPSIIEISYHGISEAAFDGVTGISGSAQKVNASISLLLENQIPLRLKTTALEKNYSEILPIKNHVQSLGGALFRLGRDLRASADGSRNVLDYQLSDEKLYALNLSDPELMKEEDRLHEEQKNGKPGCHEGRIQFHIDAYGQLQLCSANRRKSYDLRNGSFKEGFYQALPGFPCSYKNPAGKESCGGCA